MGIQNLGKVRLTPKGAWAAGLAYEALDTVSYQGSSYLCVQDAPAGTLPTNTTYYQLSAGKGDEGIQGPQGTTGLQGAAGPQGDQGIQGVAGNDGSDGAAGAQGPAGATGAAGQDGAGVTIEGSDTWANVDALSTQNVGDMWILTEVTGAPARAADSSAAQVGDGVNWDGTNWVNSGAIRGPAGPTGASGSDGAQGPAGPQGTQGVQGPAGADFNGTFSVDGNGDLILTTP